MNYQSRGKCENLKHERQVADFWIGKFLAREPRMTTYTNLDTKIDLPDFLMHKLLANRTLWRLFSLLKATVLVNPYNMTIFPNLFSVMCS